MWPAPAVRCGAGGRDVSVGQEALILQPSAACRLLLQLLWLTCGLFHCPPSGFFPLVMQGLGLEDYTDLRSAHKGERLRVTLSQLVVMPKREADGGKEGGSRPQNAHSSFCGHLIVSETIVKERVVYPKCVRLCYPFTFANF